MFQSEKSMTFIMLLVPLVWALSGVSAKYLSFYISEDEIVVYRFFLSALSTLPLLLWMKIPMNISPKNFVICILLAFFLIGNYRTYFMGMQRGAVGLGAALVTVLIPIFVYIMMIFSKKSKPILKDWLALAMGVAGVALMLDLDQLNLERLVTGGNIYFVLAALTYAMFTVAASYMRSIHVLTINFYVCLIGFLIDWNLSYDSNHLFTLGGMDYIFWINILFVSVVAGTAITAVYYTGLRIIGSKKSSAFSILTPFFAIALGAIFFGEMITINNAIGIVMAVMALFVLNDLKIKNMIPFR
ncbi:MAG: DMT family transporter [Candidatus Thioglobus sp.]|nr:DMT family transporter [Candidatus Thioglobus sp.]|tara:strand:- start:486 stop:1385 length:900 start_codon:yes stop_codon:yes gene_type:complete